MHIPGCDGVNITFCYITIYSICNITTRLFVCAMFVHRHWYNSTSTKHQSPKTRSQVVVYFTTGRWRHVQQPVSGAIIEKAKENTDQFIRHSLPLLL